MRGLKDIVSPTQNIEEAQPLQARGIPRAFTQPECQNEDEDDKKIRQIDQNLRKE